MRDASRKFQYNYKKIVRDKKNLYIFPDKPFWIVGDESLEVFIKVFSEELELNSISQILINDFSYNEEEVRSVFTELDELFEEAGLFNENSTENNAKFNNEQFAVPVINITKSCNLACRHCYADAAYGNSNDDSKELTTEQWKRVISDIAELVSTRGEDRILLTGGEPFLRSDIMEIINYIKCIGFRPLINTNGLLIKDEFLDKLEESRAELLVSLDGSEEGIHELLRGKGTFNKTIEIIKKLKNHNVITRLSFTVHRGNFDDIKKYVELAKKLEIEDIAINNLTVLSRAAANNLERVGTKDINKTIKQLSDKASDNNDYLNTTDYAKQGAILLENFKFNYCGVGSASLCIDADGSVYPCYNTMVDDFKVGNVLENKLNELWKSSEVLSDLRNLDVDKMNNICKKCDVRYYCGGGCRGEAYFSYNDINAPYPYCKDTKDSIIDLMFNISIEDELFKNKVDYFRRLKEAMAL